MLTFRSFIKQRLSLGFTMAFFSLFSMVLLFFRMTWTGRPMFLFLVWNLFLAWIPWVISSLLTFLEDKKRSWILMLVLMLIWILFFPNSPYILTDLFHLRVRHPVPLWYDLVLILSFAFSGMLLGFLSLMDIQKWIKKRSSSFWSWLSAVLALLLGSFGIYVGRFLRWNSWDILMNPVELIADMGDRIIHPRNHPRTYGITLLFFFFLLMVYVFLHVFKNNSRSLEKDQAPTSK